MRKKAARMLPIHVIERRHFYKRLEPFTCFASAAKTTFHYLENCFGTQSREDMIKSISPPDDLKVPSSQNMEKLEHFLEKETCKVIKAILLAP